MVANTIFGPMLRMLPSKKHLTFKLMSLTSTVYTYLHAGRGLCTSFNKVYLF